MLEGDAKLSLKNLTDVLEHFVALLRNKLGTTPADVELFFKDHAKLIAKMDRTKTTSVTLELVEAVDALI